MKYQNTISNKFAIILNNNTNNVKITFKNNNSLIKRINKGTTKFHFFMYLRYKE
jgi:hypothetical protein